MPRSRRSYLSTRSQVTRSRPGFRPLWAVTEEFDHLFIPASKPSRYNNKLMIVLHGRGDSLRPFRHFDEELNFPEINYLLLNAPRRWDSGYTWYAFPPNQKLGVLKARRKLTALMDELDEQGWNCRDIFLLGFSQGSLVSCDFGMNYKKRIGGIIGISGYIYFFPRWQQRLPKAAFQTPWLITHGTEDVDLEIDETRVDVQKMIAAGLPIEWKELRKEHEIEAEYELPMIKRWMKRSF